VYLRLSRSRKPAPQARLRHAVSSQLDELRGRDALTGLVTRPSSKLVLDEAVLECDRTGTTTGRGVPGPGQLPLHQ
jgi:hypothetical protein